MVTSPRGKSSRNIHGAEVGIVPAVRAIKESVQKAGCLIQSKSDGLRVHHIPVELDEPGADFPVFHELMVKRHADVI